MKLISRLSCGQVLLFLSSLFSLGQVAKCDIRAFNLLLEPSSTYIHYIEGFIITPGYIDLSELIFVASDSTVVSPQSSDRTKDEGNRHDSSTEGSALDIAVFLLPESCDSTPTGCDWSELGIGARSDDGILKYCCSKDAIESGLCTDTQNGRLIVDEIFSGKHRMINVPANGDFSTNLANGHFEETGDPGNYLVIFANCNVNEGRRIIVEGHTVWNSRHGYLPGDLFGLMHFLAGLLFVYFALFLWFGTRLKTFQDSRIPIQNWIFGTICMGTLEMAFRSGDLFVWNEDGTRSWIGFYVGEIVGVLKGGISRCLLVMVSLGWGVTCDELGPTMKKIHLLGGLYIVIHLLFFVMTEVALSDIQRMSQEEEEGLVDIAFVLRLVLVLIDMIFYFWIIDSLSGTMEHLENMKQTRKLLRYLRMRMILMFSLLFAVMWSVFNVVDRYDQGIVTQGAKWVLDASLEFGYLFVLIAVAYLWRPQANSRDYANVMELTAIQSTGDDDECDGEIELFAAVPSAADDSDEDEFNDEIES